MAYLKRRNWLIRNKLLWMLKIWKQTSCSLTLWWYKRLKLDGLGLKFSRFLTPPKKCQCPKWMVPCIKGQYLFPIQDTTHHFYGYSLQFHMLMTYSVNKWCHSINAMLQLIREYMVRASLKLVSLLRLWSTNV